LVTIYNKGYVLRAEYRPWPYGKCPSGTLHGLNRWAKYLQQDKIKIAKRKMKVKSNLELIKSYFSLLENFSTDIDSFKKILHPRFKQKEFPNALSKNGQESNFDETMQRLAVGKNMLINQTYDIVKTYESNETHIIVEAIWSGKIRNEIGPFKAGQMLKAHFCIICEFENNKIVFQKNYDCFDPF
jgi:hypothetical protein